MRPTLKPIRTWRFAMACAAIALLAGSVSFLSTVHAVRASGQPAIAPTTPFSAAMVQIQFWPPGTDKVGTRTTWNFYRFTDGSYSEKDTRQVEPEGRPGIDKAVDLRLRQDLLMEPVTKSVITIKRAPGEQVNDMQGAWEENCPGDDDNVESTEPGEAFFGFRTIHVVKNFDSNWKQDRWMIRELRCFSVKEIDVAGPSKNEHLATSLVLGEPPRSILSAPDGYIERSPAETMKAYALAKGGDQLFSAGLLKRLTEDYNKGK